MKGFDERWRDLPGELSLGQLAVEPGKNKHETLTLPGELKVLFVDYDLREDLITLDELFPAKT